MSCTCDLHTVRSFVGASSLVGVLRCLYVCQTLWCKTKILTASVRVVAMLCVSLCNTSCIESQMRV